MHIAVGSSNPVKINAVINACTETWPDVVVEGFDVPSGVDDQPRSDEETVTGAVNRAKEALKMLTVPDQDVVPLFSRSAHIARNQRDDSPALESLAGESRNLGSDQVLGVGLEGGVFTDKNGDLWSTVWVAVADREGNVFTANGARCKVPEPIASLIQSGKEMGPAVDSLLTGESVRQKQGMIGVITKGFVDRTEEYSAIAKFALGLWYGRDWYSEKPEAKS